MELSARDDWRLLLERHEQQLTDQLVLHDSAVTRVLAKFESPEFLHTYVPAGSRGGGGSSGDGSASGHGSDCSMQSDGGGSDCSMGGGSDSAAADTSGCSTPGGAAASAHGHRMLFELPRFQLEFELRGGTLWSRDHDGYQLASCQQLWEAAAAAEGAGGGPSFTLPDFRQYLVLQPAEPGGSSSRPGPARTLLLVPEGRVRRHAAHVGVEHAARSDAKLRASARRAAAGCTCLASLPPSFARSPRSQPACCLLATQAHTYDVHPRFGHLVAGSIRARLQLAALYAATASLLPEPGSRMTGAQTAMALVRQSWGMQPLGEDEVQLLQDMPALGGELPSWYIPAASGCCSGASTCDTQESGGLLTAAEL